MNRIDALILRLVILMLFTLWGLGETARALTCDPPAVACLSGYDYRDATGGAGYGLGCVVSISTGPCSLASGPNLAGQCEDIGIADCPGFGPNNCLESSCNGGTCSPGDPKAEIKIIERSAGSPDRGTVLLLTGGPGSTWWEVDGWDNAKKTGSAVDAIYVLSDLGYRTIQIRWHETWFGAADGQMEGPKRAACRGATLFRYIYDRFHTTGAAFCGDGGSAGGSILMYALSNYGQGDVSSNRRLFDGVVTNSGAFPELFEGCSGNAPDGGPSPEKASPTDFRFRVVSRQLIDRGYGDYDTDPFNGLCGLGDARSAAEDCFVECAAIDFTAGDCSSCFPNDTNLIGSFDFPRTSVSVLTPPSCDPDHPPVGSVCTEPNKANCPIGCDDPATTPPYACDGCSNYGDERYGSTAAANAWYGMLDPTTPSFTAIVPDSIHDMTVSVSGAHDVRDQLLINCVVQP